MNDLSEHLRSTATAEQGVAAEQLDRADFAFQMRYNAILIYQCDTFQPPAERQTVGPPTT